ncbi:MAG: hypothetical protein WC220_10055 [Pedobacter sp.]
MAKRLTQKPQWAGETINGIINDLRNKFGRSLTVFPKGKEIVPLHFRITEPGNRRDREIRMLDLINNARKKTGTYSAAF